MNMRAVLSIMMMLSLQAPAVHAEDIAAHAAHTQAAPASNDGPWSYRARKNPPSYTAKRWEMVPGEGNSATYLASDRLTPEQRCRALLNQTVTAVDRATRAQCTQLIEGKALTPAAPATEAPAHRH